MSEPALDMSEIIGLYKDDARRMIDEMRSALGRWGEVASGGPAQHDLRRLSHQLRGSGRTYGYRNVTCISKAVEQIVQKLEKQAFPADERVQRSIAAKIEKLAGIFRE